MIAPYWQESRLLNAAHQYQQGTEWHRSVPAAFA
jgi:aspartyl-tRNA(Asn)/glutamyl-tRNA(Gln) amidotransferase subunit A